MAGLLLLFGAAGAARLNSFCLLEPDSPDYLFTSRSLATLRGYTEIDLPGEPAHTLRPPGLPLLLVPLSWVRPYDVVSAKLVILGCTLALLAAVHGLTRRITDGRGGGALAALVLVASGPFTLLHATEIVTEIPFVLCVLGLLLMLARSTDPPTIRQLVLGTLLLAFAPLLRTIGVTLVAAVGLWALVTPPRRRWLVAAGAAVVPTILWGLRSGRAEGPTYLASIAIDYKRSGLATFVGRAVASGRDYLGQLGDLMLPGLGPGQPLYERFTLGAAPEIAGLGVPAALLSLAVMALALTGMFARRRREGLVVLAYLLLYVVALAVYPPKHERLAWPLVPLLWIYAPVGLTFVASGSGPRRSALRGTLRIAAIALVGALVAVQLWACAATLRPNLRRLSDRAQFHAETIPPMYYADWQSAGRWLRENAPVHARVLTRHSDVGLTSGRWQDSLRFEELSPARWRQRIARFKARYLVVATSDLGKSFHWPAIAGDPVYTYIPVHEAHDVLVLEITPNLSGFVSAVDESELRRKIEAGRRALGVSPGRVDLERRLAELYAEAGREEEAARMLRELTGRHAHDVGLHKSLGTLLLELGRAREALDAFEHAAGLPDAAHLASSIERGIERARAALDRPEPTTPTAQAREQLEKARWKSEILDYAAAEVHATRAGRLAPEDPEVLFVQAEIEQRFGRAGPAEAYFRAALAAGHPGAEAKLRMLRSARALETENPPDAGAETFVQLAVMLAGDGTPGRALRLLEQVSDRHRDSPELLRRLADLYLFYGVAERSEPLFRRVLQLDPGDRRARQGLEQSLELLRPPTY